MKIVALNGLLGYGYSEKALDIAEHGLVMTLGELGHRRWKRLDFISKHYSNIKTIEDITVENFVEEINRGLVWMFL